SRTAVIVMASPCVVHEPVPLNTTSPLFTEELMLSTSSPCTLTAPLLSIVPAMMLVLPPTPIEDPVFRVNAAVVMLSAPHPRCELSFNVVEVGATILILPAPTDPPLPPAPIVNVVPASKLTVPAPMCPSSPMVMAVPEANVIVPAPMLTSLPTAKVVP